MEEPKYKVHVNLYDLSQGMARQFSQALIGKQIEGIWHTGIVVYGTEYFFGGGICSGVPRQTPYGAPVREIPMGETEIPKEIFHEFLQNISPKFSMETYDLFNNNCNNFTEECAQFLVGASIPSYITGLPQEFLSTPLGQMIQPMIQRMQQQISTGGSQMFPQMFEGGAGNSQPLSFGGGNQYNKPAASNQSVGGGNPIPAAGNPLSNPQLGGFNNPNLMSGQGMQNIDFNRILQNLGGMGGMGGLGGMGGIPGGFNAQPSANSYGGGGAAVHSDKVKEITSFREFTEIAQKYKGVVVDFYSSTCPPCQMIKPIYARIAEQYSKTHPHIKFCMVNGQNVRDMSTTFQIRAFPTFKFFFEEDEIDTLVGANEQKLRQSVEKLAVKVSAAAGNNNANAECPLSQSRPQCTQQVTFNIYNPSISERQFYKGDKYDTAINKIKSTSNVDKVEGYQAFLAFSVCPIDSVKTFTPDQRAQLVGFLLANLTNMNDASAVPFLDILSGIIANPEFCETLFSINIKKVMELFTMLLNNLKTLLRPVRILLLRLVVNFFSDRKGLEFIAKEMEGFRTLIANWENVAEDKTCIRSIIYICYNIVILGKNLKIQGDLELELLQRLLKILEVEIEDLNFLSILIAVIHLIYKNDKLIEWIRTQGICKYLDRPKISKDEKVVYAARDLQLILEGKI